MTANGHLTVRSSLTPSALAHPGLNSVAALRLVDADIQSGALLAGFVNWPSPAFEILLITRDLTERSARFHTEANLSRRVYAEPDIHC